MSDPDKTTGDTGSTLAERLRNLRERNQLSLEDVAAKGGISKTYLWELERDTGRAKKPSADVLLRLREDARWKYGAPPVGSRKEIESHGHAFTPGRYVGAEETEDDDDMPFEERMEQLTAKLKGQFAESAKLEKAILKNLASLGFTGKESS